MTRDFEKETGIKREHLIAMAETAVANDTTIIFRPVNDSVIKQFDEGAVGKGMDVKGKSADQGDDVGLNGRIPTDQELSKLGTKNDHESIDIYNKKNKDKIDEDNKRYQKIKEADISNISGAELVEFEESLENIVESVPHKDKEGNEVYYFKDEESGHALKDEDNNIVFAVKKGDKLYAPGSEEEFSTPEGYSVNQVEVLSYRNLSVESNKLVEKDSSPITADYDQLAVFTKAENKGKSFPLEGNEKRGYATEVGHVVTAALAEDTKDKLAVSHGQETGNPTPEMLVDDKYTVIEPTPKIRKISHELSQQIKDEKHPEKEKTLVESLENALLESVSLLKSEDDILEFYNKKEDEGYQAPVNPGWGWERNESGKYQVDPDRAQAQDIYKAEHKFNHRKDLAPLIKRMSSIHSDYRKSMLEGDKEYSASLEHELAEAAGAFYEKSGGYEAPVVTAAAKEKARQQESNNKVEKTERSFIKKTDETEPNHARGFRERNFSMPRSRESPVSVGQLFQSEAKNLGDGLEEKGVEKKRDFGTFVESLVAEREEKRIKVSENEGHLRR